MSGHVTLIVGHDGRQCVVAISIDLKNLQVLITIRTLSSDELIFQSSISINDARDLSTDFSVVANRLDYLIERHKEVVANG